jgi:hypothetical protein
MRRYLVLALLLTLPAWSAEAQQPRRPPDQIQPEAPAPEGDGVGIMDRPLPFRDGQVVPYLDKDGHLVGTASRHGLTIRFYDADGHYLGRAVRVSQAATRYYDANGSYLGRRLHRQLVR